MKDEIKEILNNVDSNTKFKMVDEDGTKKEMNIAGLIEQLLNDNKHLLDYITNLQEEVKSANESITWWQNRFNALQKENKKLKHNLEQMYNDTKDTYNEICAEQIDYKSRIDKAIPMLKELNIKIKEILKIGIDIKEISNIESILNGGDE